MSNAVGSDGAPHSLGAAIERLRAKWGAIVAFGVLLVVLGVMATAFAVFASVATVVANGVAFLVAGAAEVAIGARARDWRHFFFWVIGGVLYAIIGLFCILRPDLGLVAITLALGAGLIAAGVVRALLAFRLQGDPGRTAILLTSVLTFLLGLIIVTHWPVDSLYILGTLLGVDLIFHGAGWISFGLGLRAHH